MTTTSKASRETEHGERVTDWDLNHIARSYDAAKANIADPAAEWAHDENEAWPETEAIDVRAINPPAASRGTSPEPAPAPRRHGVGAPAAHPWRAWRSWFSFRA